jgi:hypothetical protein
VLEAGEARHCRSWPQEIENQSCLFLLQPQPCFPKLSVIKGNTREHETCKTLISKLDWGGALAELLSREVKDARGNIQMVGGGAGQAHRKDKDDGVTVPQPTNSVSILWLVQQIVNMSAVVCHNDTFQTTPVETRDSHLPSLQDMTSRESTPEST